MKPSDFLELAQPLVAHGTEAAFRTTVSRAYYGAFHKAVMLIREMGVEWPAGPESHQKVRFCLMEAGEVSGTRAGDMLQSLRQDRNLADYDLDTTAKFNAKFANQRIARAHGVIRLLDKCADEPVRTKFRDTLRVYAANVLRLTVK